MSNLKDSQESGKRKDLKVVYKTKDDKKTIDLKIKEQSLKF